MTGIGPVEVVHSIQSNYLGLGDVANSIIRVECLFKLKRCTTGVRKN